ncbi:MAG: serine/threonine-protein phosphatase [Chloroflexi bacterium]|nr:serine/threonine-protein phosphatase [Chloroflexota bacterium]
MPTITLAAKTDVGLVRQNNEDSFVALGGEKSPPGLDALLVVADGMGGHAAGEVASRMAVEGVVRMMDVDGTSYWKLLEEVNREIHQAGEDSDKAGMGTTCTVAAISGGTLYLAHVGDSPSKSRE